MISWGKKMN